MVKYQIQVGKELSELLERNAERAGLSAEKFILEILNRFTLDGHTMESEEVAKAYEECGEMNLELANL